MRLTRRGRVVLVLLAVALAFGIGAVAGQAQAGRPENATQYETVYVAPGQTMWGIAEGVAGNRDVRDVVAMLVDLNALDSSELVAGQELLVPVVG